MARCGARSGAGGGGGGELLLHEVQRPVAGEPHDDGVLRSCLSFLLTDDNLSSFLGLLISAVQRVKAPRQCHTSFVQGCAPHLPLCRCRGTGTASPIDTCSWASMVGAEMITPASPACFFDWPSPPLHFLDTSSSSSADLDLSRAR
jgi:hypothetical protein